MPSLRSFAATLTLALAASALAGGGIPEGWHPNLDDGLKAAKGSGRPVLVVTVWPPGT